LAVLGGRFIGYVRPLVPFAAGAGGMRYPTFVAYGAPAAFAWGSGSVLLGVFFGVSGERVIRTFGIGAVAAVTAVLVAGFTVIVVRRRRRAAQG
jgi:undecaprenyl-diphosphatase